MPGRLRSELMSAAWKALLVESAPTPIDSRKSMAGSSASKLRHTKHVSDMNEAKCRTRSAHLFTTSILLLDSQRGISASLCVQSSGWSVFIQSSHTKLI